MNEYLPSMFGLAAVILILYFLSTGARASDQISTVCQQQQNQTTVCITTNEYGQSSQQYVNIDSDGNGEIKDIN